jgi:hypothetical protein
MTATQLSALALTFGGTAAALSLINLILAAYLWRLIVDPTLALAKIAALKAAVQTLASADVAQVTSQANDAMSKVNAALDDLGTSTPGYVAPPAA